MKSFLLGACGLALVACAAPVGDIGSHRAPLVLASSVAAETALADLPAGCEDRLEGDEVVIEVLSEHPDLALARVDGAAACVDAAAALIEDLTEGDEEAEEVAFRRYAAAREEASEDGLGPEHHADAAAPEPETGADAAGGDPHPVPMDAPGDAAGGDPHPVPMDAPGDAAQGDPHPVPMDQPGDAAQGDPHPVPMDREAAPTEAPEGDPLPGDATQGDPHPVPMAPSPDVTADTAAT